MSYQSALNKINTVKNEVNDGMNTADRVGDAMKESLDYAKGKPDTVDISQYLSAGAELPLGCYYIYYGNPTHTLAGRYTYTDTYFIAVCISHWEHAHTLAIYTKNSQNQYVYYETFRTDQAATAFEKYIASLFAGAPATYQQDGLMSAEDKEIFDKETPRQQDSQESSLDVTDENGYVIVRLNNGEIETKNFNSANAPVQTLTPVDFDIADENGCVILRIEGGHIKTKNFDSSTSGGGGGDFSHELSGLKVLIVGDSITVGQGLEYPTTQRWGSQLAVKYNWDLTLDAQGGIPLASNANNRNCIVKKLESNLSLMQSAPPDLVIIWGGHNDRSYQATPFGDFTVSDKTNWCGCLRYCAEKCHQYAPNAKIFILTMLHGGTYDPMAAMALTPDKTVSDMAGAIFNAGRMFGMEVVDMSLCGINEVSGDSGNLTSDNTHPNLLGTKQIVEFLSRQLELRYVKYKTL